MEISLSLSLEEAYARACQQIGEGHIREAVLKDALAQRDAELAELRKPTLDLEGGLDDPSVEQKLGSNGSVPEAAPAG